MKEWFMVITSRLVKSVKKTISQEQKGVGESVEIVQ